MHNYALDKTYFFGKGWRDNPFVSAAAYAKGVFFNRENWNEITANAGVDPVSIYSIIPGGDYSAVSYFSKISEQTGGKLYTTNSSVDIANALLDITGDITHTTDETPESVPEPSPVMGLWTVVFAGLGLSRLKRKKPVEACKPLL